MPREARHCRNCHHCRATGSALLGTLRIWCRLGYWELGWIPWPNAPRKRFFYRSWRQVLWRRNKKLEQIARLCPHFNRPLDFLTDDLIEKPA